MSAKSHKPGPGEPGYLTMEAKATLFDSTMNVLQLLRDRYKPTGSKQHCWLCNTDLEHGPGCPYPLIESAVDALPQSVLTQEWFVKQIAAYFASAEQTNMAAESAQVQLAQHLWANQPGLYTRKKREGAEQ